MVPELSVELQNAVHCGCGAPVSLVDPSTNMQYVLIRKELYDRLLPIPDDVRLTDLEQRRLIQDAGRRAGWNDPEMDAYDHYDDYRRAQT